MPLIERSVGAPSTICPALAHVLRAGFESLEAKNGFHPGEALRTYAEDVQAEAARFIQATKGRPPHDPAAALRSDPADGRQWSRRGTSCPQIGDGDADTTEWTVRDVANALGLGPRQVRSLAETGKLPARRDPGGRRAYRFDPAQVRAFADQRERQA